MSDHDDASFPTAAELRAMKPPPRRPPAQPQPTIGQWWADKRKARRKTKEWRERRNQYLRQWARQAVTNNAGNIRKAGPSGCYEHYVAKTTVFDEEKDRPYYLSAEELGRLIAEAYRSYGLQAKFIISTVADDTNNTDSLPAIHIYNYVRVSW